MGKRSRGEGSIYKRKDGRWCGKYVDANGKTCYLYGKTKAEVRVKLTKAVADKDAGIVYDAENLTIGVFLDKWLDAVKGSVRDRTWQRHEEVVRLHLKPTIGCTKLDKLNALQVQSVYRQKLDEGLSARSVEIIHATLHKALKQAVRWSLILRNVAEAVTSPRPAKKEIQPLTSEQLKALLTAARDDKLYALYVLAVTTGMRNGELLGRQWKDIDFEGGTLTVNRSVFNGNVSPPKTSNARRTIRHSKLAIRAIKQYRVNVAKHRISEWVFSTKAGTSIRVHNLHNRSWKPLLKRAGLPHTTRFHDLRHSCISLLLARGDPVKVVSEMADHADVSITLSVYGHVLRDMQSLSADAMDNALEGDDQEQKSS
jgi:integrase